MSLKVLLQDHQTAELGLISAGEVIDDSEHRYTVLANSKAPFKAYTSQMDDVIAAYRAQRKVLAPSSSCSLLTMLTGNGL